MDYNNNNNPYVQQNHDHSGQAGQFIRNPGQTMATVSMVLGVLSIFTMLTVYIPLAVLPFSLPSFLPGMAKRCWQRPK